MTIFNPFLQMNFNSFTFGNYFAAGFNNFLFGGAFSSVPFGFTNPFAGSNPGMFSSAFSSVPFEFTNPFAGSNSWAFSSASAYNAVPNIFDFGSTGTVPQYNTTLGGWNVFDAADSGWNTFDNFGNYDSFESSSRVQTPPKLSKSDKTKKNKPVISSEISNKNVSNLQWWKDQGYNEEKGLEFASVAKEVSDKMHAAKSESGCGTGVRKSVNEYFYSDEKEHYSGGWYANVVGSKYLSIDKNFKKITIPSDMSLGPNDIPAGAIIIYDLCYSDSEASAKYGHIEVSGGNGCGYSDVTTTLLSNRGRERKPKEIWIPVGTNE